jgi:isopentenyl phosphate kinase
MNLSDLTFLKLGGSLITDKDRPRTARSDVLARLAGEIRGALADLPGLPLILGHGSGSFGHSAASRHGTRAGVRGQEGWRGFAEVWKDARALNQIVVEALESAGLPVIAFPPSAAVIARDGRAISWDLAPLRAALEAGLIPLINGDTIFDEQRGGTILSTEDLFFYLAHQLGPRRILLAGIEEGVWADFPVCSRMIDTITPETFAGYAAQIAGSASVDVTGGMLEKVRNMVDLAATQPNFEALIFSGARVGAVAGALAGSAPGTRIARA